MAECLEVAGKFIQRPRTVEDIKHAAVDYCVKHTGNKDKYICANFRDAVDLSLRDLTDDSTLTKEAFCALTEARMHEAFGATLVPNMGKGELVDFKVDKEACQDLAAKAMHGKGHLHREDAGDIWHTMCLQQDCGSMLPSRSKDCHVDRAATHNAWVCEAAMRHMKVSSKHRERQDISAPDLCDMYDQFVGDLGVCVEAYVFVLHKGDREHLPPPEQAERAIMSSQLIHDAGGRSLKAGEGQQIKPNEV